MPQPASGLEGTFGIRAREILSRGAGVLPPLPGAGDLEALDDDERRTTFDGLRVELYALSAIIADEAIGRSLSERGSYPPYGLLRSLFSDFGVISDSPSALGEDSITDYRQLGKGLIDTTVFHLDSYLKELKKSERGWLLDRLGRLLALFRLGAPRQTQARMRDAFSFIYGGLQFGTSTAVQLAEVMSRLLRPTSMTPQEKRETMKRSIRPAYDLAALNVDDVAAAYAALQPPTAGPEAGSAKNPAGWMDTDKFTIRQSEDGNPRIVLAPGALPQTGGAGSYRFSTQGCPARLSPAGHRSPVGRLWEWSVELADAAGLIDARPQ